MAPRSVRMFGSDWPVQLPSISDARLHTAGVVLTVHTLGQVTLGFAVSVPQIGSAILASAAVEFLITAVRHHRLAWPASAMLTGSGVGLIMRVDGTIVGEHWSWHRWWWFSLVAIASLLTKYLFRWRGSHVFNPSNVGLVVAFLLLGSSRVEPLPFHWGSLGPGLVIAYAVVIIGGVLITRRLHLLEMAVAFWVMLAVGLGMLAHSGHCMTVPWSVVPACGGRFWWSVLMSPEVFVFVFFMLPDPRTVPSSRCGRLWFAVFIGALATVMIAPQRDEFGAKVALLGALAVACAARPGVTWLAGRPSLRASSAMRHLSPDERGVALGVAVIAALGLFWVGTTQAGAGAREAVRGVALDASLPRAEGLLDWSPPHSLPDVTFDPDVLLVDDRFSEAAVRHEVVVAMLRNLAVELELNRRGESGLLRAVDHGSRLLELQTRPGVGLLDIRRVDRAHLTIGRVGRQTGPVLGVEIVAEVATSASVWTGTVSIRRADDGRWLIVAVAADH